MPSMSASGNMSPQSMSRMLALELDAGAVAADLAESAEERDVDGCCHQSRASPSRTFRARSARPAGAGPMGGRHSPDREAEGSQQGFGRDRVGASGPVSKS